ncbi:hypothetical protein ACFOSC_00380 [Streptantibioticus rubrisoli]|uniref:Uncharacterized protein n=1 Tax=Streptantibioticus rubrisoli TaxID=1387313 RepID=A0ABT1PID6_9ACTN|nr:hypothetical protein [Streptantibioticus rubrisoli]MCQ4045129.1 hypothetical protein [Streptantibioticus rubrisoli]
MGLRLLYLIFCRLLDWLTLLGRSSAAHKVERPRISWAERCRCREVHPRR